MLCSLHEAILRALRGVYVITVRAVLLLDDALPGEMTRQCLLAVLVDCGALSKFLQRVSEDQLVVRSREEGGRHIDKNGDPRIVVVRKDLSAKEDCGKATASKITSQVR